MKRFVITSIKKDGSRQMTFDNNHYNTYETREIAETKLKNIFENNPTERIRELMGEDLEVTETECYPSGDSMRTYFEVPNQFKNL